MYDYTEFDNAIVIRMTGTLNISNASQFKEWLTTEFTSERGKRFIVLDMTDVESIDNFGLGIIVGVYKRFIMESRYLKIVSPNRNIKRLFELTGLDRIVKIYENVSEAISDN